MLGLVRSCAAHLDPEVRALWRAHVCGLCLSLRDTAGQPARLFTNTDAALLSVLVEAQQPWNCAMSDSSGRYAVTARETTPPR